MWGAAAAPDFTNESFASLLGPNATLCSFGKLYFTIIIIQIKFRDVTGLLAALLLSPHLLVKGFYIIWQKTDIFKLPPCYLSLVAWEAWRVHDTNFFERHEVEFCCLPRLWSPGHLIRTFWGIRCNFISSQPVPSLWGGHSDEMLTLTNVKLNNLYNASLRFLNAS